MTFRCLSAAFLSYLSRRLTMLSMPSGPMDRKNPAVR